MKAIIFIGATFLLSFGGFAQEKYKFSLNVGTSIVGISEVNAQKYELKKTRSGQLALGVDIAKNTPGYQIGLGYRHFNLRFDAKPLTIYAKFTHFSNHQMNFFVDKKISKHFMLGTGLFSTVLTQNAEKLNKKKIVQDAQSVPTSTLSYSQNYSYIKEKTPVGLLLSAKTSFFNDRLGFAITRNQAFVSFLKNGLFVGYFDARTRMAFSSWQISTSFKVR